MAVDKNVAVEFSAMLEIDYISRVNQLRVSHGGGFYSHKSNNCILKDGQYFGDLLKLIDMAMKDYGIEDAEIANTTMFDRAAIENTVIAVKAIGHPAVSLDIRREIPGKKETIALGRIIIELFSDLCPRASENFILLCTGENGRDSKTDVTLSYEGCPIHRVVPGGWLQSGDILDGSGNHSISAFGGTFEDECFSVDFGCQTGGIVGYANNGPHSNGSQFFITLGPCEWMNFSKVGFGRVLQGYSILREIERASCNYERPIEAIYIQYCGRFN